MYQQRNQMFSWNRLITYFVYPRKTDGLDDAIQIINDEEMTDSEGLIGDKRLAEEMLFQENEFSLVTVEEPPIILSSKLSSDSRISRYGFLVLGFDT